MHTARRFVLAFALMPAIALSAAAQDSKAESKPKAATASEAKPEAREPTVLEQSPIAAFVGQWTGTGVYQMGPGKSETVQVKEKAEWRFDGKAILIEGLGTVTDEDGSTRNVHDALAIVRVDEATGKVMMHAFKPDQAPVVSEITVTDDGKMQWGFEPAPGQAVRFTIECTETTWKESGEFSPDGGTTWYGFFEMNLDKE